MSLDGVVANATWAHTNVYGAGKMLATYDNVGLHFHFADWLGTRRVQTDYLGQVETTCSNQPFGDGQVCTNEAGDAADEHFTGQKRDNETGNDYFGARYYVSAMGRFLSPDYSDGPDLIPHADLGNPQSFNLYAYVGNNPLNAFDPDGHDDCSTEQDFSGGNCDEANALPPLPPPSPPPPPPPPPPGGGSGSIAGSGSDTFLGPTPTASFGPNQKSPFAGFQLAGFQSRAKQNSSGNSRFQLAGYLQNSSTDANLSQRNAVLQAARSHIGSAYFTGGGARSCPKLGFDCSGLVWYSIVQAGLKFNYAPTASMAGSPFLRPLSGGETPQPGDVVLFKGHTGFYDPDQSKTGWDILSAMNHGVGYGPASYFGPIVKVFRIQAVP